MNKTLAIFHLASSLFACQVFAQDHAAAFEDAAATLQSCDSYSSREAVILMREIALRTGSPAMLYRASVASAKWNRDEEAIFLFLVAKLSDPLLAGDHVTDADNRILPLLTANPAIAHRILGKATRRLESAGIALKSFPSSRGHPRDIIAAAEKSDAVRLDAAMRSEAFRRDYFTSRKNRCPSALPSRASLDHAMSEFKDVISQLVRKDRQIIARSGLPAVKGIPTTWQTHDGKPRIAEVSFWDKDNRYFAAIYEIDVPGDGDRIYTFGAKIRLACITDVDHGHREARDAAWGCAYDPLSVPGESKLAGRWDYP
jgi:hypothetical protein